MIPITYKKPNAHRKVYQPNQSYITNQTEIITFISFNSELILSRDSNQIERDIVSDGQSLNLVNLIKLKLDQNRARSTRSNVIDWIMSIVGNYTCIATNIHGVVKESYNLQLKGERSGSNAGMIYLRCTTNATADNYQTMLI